MIYFEQARPKEAGFSLTTVPTYAGYHNVWFQFGKVVSVKKQWRKSLKNPHIPIPWLLLKFNGQNHVSLTATSNG